MGNLADMQSALVDYIEMQGYAGYASREAANTISGSVASMKSAWTNLITGLADGNADIGHLVDNLVTTVVGDGTDRNLGVLGNIMPAVKRALNGASKLVKELLPVIVNEVPSIIQENLPILANAAVSLVKSLVDGISKNQDMLAKTAMDTIMFLADSILEMLPEIVKLGLNLIVSLAKGIAKNVPKLAKSVIQVIFEIVDVLTDKKSLSELLDAAVEIINALAEALLDDETIHSLIDAAVGIIVTLTELIGENIDKIFGAAVKIIEALVDYLFDPKNAKKIAFAGKDIVKALCAALLSAKDGLTNVASDLVGLILEKFWGIDLAEAGKNAIKSLFDGMISALTGSANSSGVGKDIANSIKGQINGSHKLGLSYVPYDGYIAELHKGERVLTATEARNYGSGISFGDVIINIDGAKYTDEQSLAAAIAEEIQNMTDRRAAVYA